MIEADNARCFFAMNSLVRAFSIIIQFNSFDSPHSKTVSNCFIKCDCATRERDNDRFGCWADDEENRNCWFLDFVFLLCVLHQTYHQKLIKCCFIRFGDNFSPKKIFSRSVCAALSVVWIDDRQRRRINSKWQKANCSVAQCVFFSAFRQFCRVPNDVNGKRFQFRSRYQYHSPLYLRLQLLSLHICVAHITFQYWELIWNFLFFVFPIFVFNVFNCLHFALSRLHT